MNIHDYQGAWPEESLDLSDTITHVCPCGSNLWHVVVSFEEFEIATYSTDMVCLECGTRAIAPTPIDHPDYQE